MNENALSKRKTLNGQIVHGISPAGEEKIYGGKDNMHVSQHIV